MKIIVSHDVDHLFRHDHYRDLIYPKLWIRSMIEFFKGYYGIKEWFFRMLTPFSKYRHNIHEVMEFDKRYNVKSSFFFGMKKGLGMSYDKKDAAYIIKEVDSKGFDVGVHGIDYTDEILMNEEYNSFRNIIGRDDFGIRMHYVRFNEETFNKLERSGYLFDTTEFDKEKGFLIKNPYRIGEMWEFPLAIMDGYLPKNLEQKKKKTLELIEKAENSNIDYLTVLFHDYLFCKGYATERDWYRWIIEWFSDNGYEFISYKDAIKEMSVSNNEL